MIPNPHPGRIGQDSHDEWPAEGAEQLTWDAELITCDFCVLFGQEPLAKQVKERAGFREGHAAAEGSLADLRGSGTPRSDRCTAGDRPGYCPCVVY